MYYYRGQGILCFFICSALAKEEAEVFTDWVASVVLLTIRKTGRYSLSPEEPQKPNDQLSQWLNWDPTLLRALSRDEYLCLIQYERVRINFLEAFYNSKYPHIPNNVYPREEQRPHQVITLALHPVETSSDLQTLVENGVLKIVQIGKAEGYQLL